MAKIQLNVELENGDSKERFEVECPYESDSAEVSGAVAELSKATDNQSIIEAMQRALSPNSELYKHFLSVFAYKGHDKAGSRAKGRAIALPLKLLWLTLWGLG